MGTFSLLENITHDAKRKTLLDFFYFLHLFKNFDYESTRDEYQITRTRLKTSLIREKLKD